VTWRSRRPHDFPEELRRQKMSSRAEKPFATELALVYFCRGVRTFPRANPSQIVMTPTPGRRVMRLVPGALFVLLGFGVIAPKSAVASCGHYVVNADGHDVPAILTHLEILEIATDLSPSPPSNVPCSGPSCRKGPTPSRLPAAPSTVRSEPWCPTAVVSLSPTPLVSDEVGEMARLSPQRLGDSIERPPRPHAAVCHS
jgi:hypothetical protein